MECSRKAPSSREGWQAEAEAVINDIRKHVLEASVSKLLISSRQNIFINIKTLENKEYCIKLTAKGFQVVGEECDKNDIHLDEPVFETPYSLLQNISPKYVSSFGEALIDKLKSLEDNNTDK